MNPSSPVTTTTPEPTPLIAFILYEDGAAGRRALRVARRLAHQSQIELQPKLWRFDLLAFPELRQAARREAEDSDLLIVATRGSTKLPSVAQDWLEDRLARRDDRGVALITLFGPHDGWSIELKDNACFYSARQACQLPQENHPDAVEPLLASSA